MKTEILNKKYKVQIGGNVVHSEDTCQDAIDWADEYYPDGYTII